MFLIYTLARGNWVEAAFEQRAPLLFCLEKSRKELKAKVMNDDWLEAVCDWTEAILGVGWTVYRNEWPTTPDEPSVMWTIGGADSSPRGMSIIEVRKYMMAYFAGSVTDKTTAAMAIVAKACQIGSLDTSDVAAPSIRLQDCMADLSGGSTAAHCRLTAAGIVHDSSTGSSGPLIGGVIRQAQLE